MAYEHDESDEADELIEEQDALKHKIIDPVQQNHEKEKAADFYLHWFGVELGRIQQN